MIPRRVLRCLLFLSLSVALPAAGQTPATLDADAADALVRAQWFEGVPDELIAPLSAEAVDHLGAILDDPTDVEAHAPALELLGRAGGPGAFEEVVGYANRRPSGEVSRAVYRARIAVPLALGYLARSDRRALAPLLAEAADAKPRAWRAGRLDGTRVAQEQRLVAMTGLALSGRPAAKQALRTMAADPVVGRHVGEALAAHSRAAAGRRAR